jgi:hypothetical protein
MCSRNRKPVPKGARLISTQSYMLPLCISYGKILQTSQFLAMIKASYNLARSSVADSGSLSFHRCPCRVLTTLRRDGRCHPLCGAWVTTRIFRSFRFLASREFNPQFIRFPNVLWDSAIEGDGGLLTKRDRGVVGREAGELSARALFCRSSSICGC